jgi:hypothetical protein
MAEPEPALELPIAVPVAMIMPPVPRMIEDVLVNYAVMDIHTDIVIAQDLDTCLEIMTPAQIDKLYKATNN